MADRIVIDTYDDFLYFWQVARHCDIERQLNLWQPLYMAKYPELLAKQIEAYAEDGYNWRDIAREHVFPFLAERLSSMTTARANLLSCAIPTWHKATTALGLDFDAVFVIYVGTGCGAGWATSYRGVPACLFGLENIAELGWEKTSTLEGLASHELGHLALIEWRKRHAPVEEEGPLWQLFDEGFATVCEHSVIGSETWHEQAGEADWLAWCTENRSWLARELLRTLEAGQDAKEFFASWHKVRGHIQTGYFLGHEVVERLVTQEGLRTTAGLPWDEVRASMLTGLHLLAAERG